MTSEANKYQLNAVLAHEAYHVACRCFENMGEDSQGEEIVAYVVQMITQCLMSCYWDRSSNGHRA